MANVEMQLVWRVDITVGFDFGLILRASLMDQSKTCPVVPPVIKNFPSDENSKVDNEPADETKSLQWSALVLWQVSSNKYSLNGLERVASSFL